MKKLTHKTLIAVLVLALVGGFFAALFMPSAASYDDRLSIDCSRDPEYEFGASLGGTTFYYTNSEANLYLFINTTSNLNANDLFIHTANTTHNITTDIMTSTTTAYHTQHLLELVYSRSELGDYFEVYTATETIANIHLDRLDLLEPPDVNILSPTTDVYGEPTRTVEVTASDPDTVIENIWYRWNTYNLTYTGPTNITFNEGLNTLTVWVNDSEGRITTMSRTFTIDTMAPDLEFVTLNNATYYDARQELQVSASDSNNIDKIWYTINDDTYEYIYKGAREISFDDGVNRITIYARDEAGNVNSKTLYFTIKTEGKPQERVPGFILWSGWMAAFGIAMVFITKDLVQKAADKEIVKVYKNYEEEETEPELSSSPKTGLKTLGTYKGQEWINERGMWKFRFKTGTLSYKTVWSLYPYDDYKQVYYLNDYLVVYVEFQAQVYREKLKDPYKDKTGWTFPAIVWKAFTFCCNFSKTGVTISCFVGSIIGAMLAPSGFFMLLGMVLGALAAFLVCILVGIIDNKFRDKIVKQKEETIEYEYRMMPTESNQKIRYKYQVEGTRYVEVKRSDGVVEREEQPLTDEDGDPLVVHGFEEVYRLEEQNDVDVESYHVVGKETVEKSRKELQNLTQTYLERNKYYAERIFTLVERNAKLNKAYRDVQKQLQYVRESKTEELKKWGEQLEQIMAQKENTIKHIFNNLAGDVFGENWDVKLEDAVRAVYESRERDIVRELKRMATIFENLIQKVGTKEGIDMERLLEKVKIKDKPLLPGTPGDGGEQAR